MKRVAFVGSIAVLSLVTTVACSPRTSSVQASPSGAIEESVTVADPASVASSPTEATRTERRGDFVDGEHPTAGTAVLTVDGETRYLEFSEQFQTDPGPDLVVVLHVSPDVIGTTAPPSHAFQEGDYVVLEPLQSVSGFQRYEIPADVDLNQYASVAIWCRQFNATFGAAALQ